MEQLKQTATESSKHTPPLRVAFDATWLLLLLLPRTPSRCMQRPQVATQWKNAKLEMQMRPDDVGQRADKKRGKKGNNCDDDDDDDDDVDVVF